MAAKKFLRLISGVTSEVLGTQTSAGAANAGDIPALNDQGVLDQTLMPTGIAPDTATVVASEAITAGRFVNIFNNSGTANARNADASVQGKEAHGFVLTAVASGANATVFFEGSNNALSGQTPGNAFLSASTPGAATATPPTTSGGIVQRLGVAVSATLVNVEIDQPVNLA